MKNYFRLFEACVICLPPQNGCFDIKSLEQRRQFQSLVMLYKCLYDKGAPYISESFNFKDVPFNSRGLSTRLDLPAFNLEFMHRSFTF